MSESVLNRYLSWAKEAALQAAQVLMQASEHTRQVDQKLPHDLKLAGDKLAESAILQVLQSRTEFPILSEECGMLGNAFPEDFWWIIDPLDGTVNYAHHLPLCCTSIGLWRGRSPLLGVIYDFNHGEMFEGIVGTGAWLNGQPIHVSRICRREEAMLSLGTPPTSDLSEASLRRLIQPFLDYHKVRMIGSSAIAQAYVACGRLDVHQEFRTKLWDIGAGSALVLAAGGVLDLELPEDPLAPVKICAKAHPDL